MVYPIIPPYRFQRRLLRSVPKRRGAEGARITDHGLASLLFLFFFFISFLLPFGRYLDIHRGRRCLFTNKPRRVGRLPKRGKCCVMDLANSDEHLPALKPLRISKSRRKVDHGRTNAVSAVNNTGPPCSVPRRHSSYAIRSSTPRSVAAARNDITATRRDQHHSDSPGYNIRNSPQTMEQVDLVCL